MKYYIGVDGGGTKTEITLFDENKTILDTVKVAGSNHENLSGSFREADLPVLIIHTSMMRFVKCCQNADCVISGCITMGSLLPKRGCLTALALGITAEPELAVIPLIPEEICCKSAVSVKFPTIAATVTGLLFVYSTRYMMTYVWIFAKHR